MIQPLHTTKHHISSLGELGTLLRGSFLAHIVSSALAAETSFQDNHVDTIQTCTGALFGECSKHWFPSKFRTRTTFVSSISSKFMHQLWCDILHSTATLLWTPPPHEPGWFASSFPQHSHITISSNIPLRASIILFSFSFFRVISSTKAWWWDSPSVSSIQCTSMIQRYKK